MENKKIFAPNHQEKACFKGFLCVFAIFLILSALCFSAGAKATTVEVGIPIEEHPELFLPRSMPIRGEGKIVVFLIDFPDYRNENPAATVEYYQRLYFDGGIITTWGQSVAQFFENESNGKLKLGGKVFDWYTAKHDRSYYDNRKEELIFEAAAYFDSLGTDFSQFDGDGDGVIDALCFHFAGEGDLDMNAPWYDGVHYSTSHGDWYGELDGKKIISYIQLKDQATHGVSMINVNCHELMHTLGMPDLYGITTALPTTDLMADNADYINPYLKILLGWLETVDVIVTDTKNVRLEPAGYDELGRRLNGSPAIVTNSFNGFFDEFYLISYKAKSSIFGAVIWHIDARLSGDGKSFMNNNLTYNFAPGEVLNPHGQPTSGTESPYLFIEEISGDPYYNFVTNLPVSMGLTAFSEDSVLGPDSMPSSDTHDGKYTGIKINNFKEHNNEYLTFDVSFVKDTSAPLLTTTPNDIGGTEEVTVQFNEHIYKGSSWSDITVTDLNGITLDVTVKKSYYPGNEIKIIFKKSIPSDGYRIEFPSGCIVDSSGNAMKATLLSTGDQSIILPENSVELPPPTEDSRGAILGNNVYFHDDSIVTLIPIAGSNDLEFIRVDYNGNVIVQKRIVYPFDTGGIGLYAETENGCYIISCMSDNKYNLLFCVDGNGNIKWTNDDYKGSSVDFYVTEEVKYKDGLLVAMIIEYNHSNYLESHCNIVYIDSNSGKIDTLFSSPNNPNEIFGRGRWLLPNGKLLRVWEKINYNSSQRDISIAIVNLETFEIEKEKIIISEPRDLSNSDFIIFGEMQVYDDGRILLFREDKPYYEAILLDENLNVINIVKLDRVGQFSNYSLFDNDGFCLVYRQENAIAHSDLKWRALRYDRYLNLMWEAKLDCVATFFGKSNTGNIISLTVYYRTDLSYIIECYGDETEYRVEHIHNLVHTEKVPATCQSEGMSEYWSCTDCGCKFSDEGNTLITDIKSILIPIVDHTFVEWIDQCDGTHASRCSCGHTIIDQHSYVDHKCLCGSVEKMNITFMNGTEIWHQDRAEYNSLLNTWGMPAPTAPTGSVFVGWYTEDGTQVEQGMIVTDHIVAYAKYVVIDIDGNGTAEKKDANTIIQYIVGTNDSVNDPTALDVNADGKVTVVDAVMLLLYLAGKTDLTN